MARAAFVHERDANRAEMGGLVADVDTDFDPPARSAGDFRKKFIEMSKRVRLSAG
ncbi:MAG: hypothetical protein M0Q43_14800 [Methanothrix sp.]|jgi:hypothetical protein|nr:hypothetical protein [Methanothrix sp.]